ncbi:MAG: protein kinase, partial [Planctomycetia bacterium]|nr:protein kinase [Planctomycetia bacterium]
MEKKLVVVAGQDKDKAFDLPATGTFTIGRSKESNTQLTDRKVSRMHCEVLLQPGKVVVTDKESATGTFVNERRLNKDEQCVLRAGDVIQIGETQLRYEDDEDVSEGATVVGAALPLAPAAIAARSSGGGVAVAEHPLAELLGVTVGHYSIDKFLAEGRSSVVFRARDTGDDRVAALKILKDGQSKSEGEMQRLQRTLKSVCGVKHANLVGLYDLGRDKGRCWFALELVEGDSLSQVIKQSGLAGLVDWQHALRVGMHLAKGLEALHQHNVVHTKITPEAVLINSTDKVAKLGGLSDARPVDLAREKPARAEEVLNYAGFAAPERARNAMYGDFRSDVYSLGATLYAMLTGRSPFESSSPVETLTKVLAPDLTPARPKEFQFLMPDALEQVVLRMLSKKPEDRHQTAGEVLADLERVVKGQNVAPAAAQGYQAPVNAGPNAASSEGTIRITCGGCGQHLKPRRKFIGTQVRCPTCKKFLVVPENEGPVQPLDALTPTPAPAPFSTPMPYAAKPTSASSFVAPPATPSAVPEPTEEKQLPKPLVIGVAA